MANQTQPALPAADGLYIGLMSGTSADGVDAVLARFQASQPPACLAAVSVPMPDALRHEILALNLPGADELHRSMLAANALADLYADAVGAVLRAAHTPAAEVMALGAHGQTVRHRPELGYTVQLNAPARLAERTGIRVVSDFRSRDVAAGGQGAPLVPAFHAALFAAAQPRAILNLGGIANVTALSPGAPVTGWDTGPANVLLDLWASRHLGASYDENGRWAASGTSDHALLAYLIDSEPWLAQPPPKSTGRDLFNAAWLDERLAAWTRQHGARDPADIQATLLALTVHTVADAVRKWMVAPEALYVAGGGARNAALMAGLKTALGISVVPTDELGVPAQDVEAFAFAWLAYAHMAGLTGSLPDVTGASAPRVLGSLTP